MQRLKSFPIALAAVLVSAGVVGAFSLPAAATKGLGIATEHADRTVPVVPTTNVILAPDANTVDAADLPDAASHGSAVSAVARGDDATPDTNHGADVSAVANQHGQAAVAEHRPANAGKPADVGQPAGAGKPADPGIPADPGPPDGAGRP